MWRSMFGVSRSSRQMEWYVHEDDSFLKEERALEHQGALVVQNILPPAGRQNFRNDNGDPDVRLLIENFFDVFKERPQD